MGETKRVARAYKLEFLWLYPSLLCGNFRTSASSQIIWGVPGDFSEESRVHVWNSSSGYRSGPVTSSPFAVASCDVSVAAKAKVPKA